jgi:hypothetical protein
MFDTLDEMPLLNGGFETCIDATSLTGAGNIGIMHKVIGLGTGGAATISQQAFTFGAGQMGAQVGDPPGDLRNFLRWAQTTLATTAPELQSRIEDVRTFAGRKVQVQGYYRSNQPIQIGLRQSFGTGGSPSPDVDTALQTLPATTDSAGVVQWRPFQRFFDLPTMAGATLGSTANTSFIAIRFLGPLSTVFQYDLADLRISVGGERIATHRKRPVSYEVELLTRYYDVFALSAPVSTQSPNGCLFTRQMRVTPTVTASGATIGNITVDSFDIVSTGSAGTKTVTADARL